MILRSAVGLAAAALALAAPVHAEPGRVALGLTADAVADAVAYDAWALSGSTIDRELQPVGALLLSVPDVAHALPALRAIPGVAYAEPIERSRTLSFTPDDPLALFQWHLASIHAFDFWEAPPEGLPPVRVAVIDSGVEATNPDLAGRIVASRSFVGGRATQDTVGHGTLVAGEIAATLGNGVGVAGVGLSAELLIAKVVDDLGRITTEDEAKAIRWAVDNGAQVINLSLGGRRDPLNPGLDEYSELEADAVEYAYANGVIVVAATGNCSGPPCPYGYASWPAALPHVVGVGSMSQTGAPSSFSNRDGVYNDLIAPGEAIISTYPEALTDPVCGYPGFSLCARPEHRSGSGTSFAAPLASAAAAVLLAAHPGLTSSQVLQLLRDSATDLGPAGRDAASGAGLLDLAQALTLAAAPTLPPADAFETNDDGTRTNGDAGRSARTLYGARPRVRATVDFFDDPSDVYRVYVRAGRPLRLSLAAAGGKPTLVLWRPGTKHVTSVTALAVRSGSVLAFRTGSALELTYRTGTSSWFYVEVKAPKRNGAAYDLKIVK